MSECVWSPVRSGQLAATCSNAGIFLFDCISDADIQSTGELTGHDGVASAKWSNESDNRLVSAGFDGSVRVWDTKALQCTALYQYDSPMFFALFLPTDENFVMCSGHKETLHMFDARRHMHEVKPISKSGRSPYANDLRWARPTVDAQKMLNIEKKQNKRHKNERAKLNGGDGVASSSSEPAVAELNQAMEKVNLKDCDGGGDKVGAPAMKSKMVNRKQYQ